MAITDEEWKKLEKLLDDKLEEKLENKLEQKLESKLEQKLESKLEGKLETKLGGKLDQKLKPFGQDIITQITSYIDESIIPLINEKADKSDVERIERKLDDAIDKLYGHEERISNIERIPAIAHSLSIKKPTRKSQIK